MVQELFEAVRDTKGWVKVGVSPFGIWRPGNPAQITGLDAFAEIYADSHAPYMMDKRGKMIQLRVAPKAMWMM